MRTFAPLLAGLLAWLALAHAALAEPFVHEEAQVRFEAPPGWSSQVEGDILTLWSPDETAALVIAVVQPDELSDLNAALDAALGELFEDLTPKGKPQKVKHNGLAGVSARATGQLEGANIELRTLLLKLSEGRALLLVGFMELGAPIERENQLRAVLQGVRPL